MIQSSTPQKNNINLSMRTNLNRCHLLETPVQLTSFAQGSSCSASGGTKVQLTSTELHVSFAVVKCILSPSISAFCGVRSAQDLNIQHDSHARSSRSQLLFIDFRQKMYKKLHKLGMFYMALETDWSRVVEIPSDSYIINHSVKLF